MLHGGVAARTIQQWHDLHAFRAQHRRSIAPCQVLFKSRGIGAHVGPRRLEIWRHSIIQNCGRYDPSSYLRRPENPVEDAVEVADDVLKGFSGQLSITDRNVGEVSGFGGPNDGHAEANEEGGGHEGVVARVVVGGNEERETTHADAL